MLSRRRFLARAAAVVAAAPLAKIPQLPAAAAAPAAAAPPLPQPAVGLIARRGFAETVAEDTGETLFGRPIFRLATSMPITDELLADSEPLAGWVREHMAAAWAAHIDENVVDRWR